MINENRLEAGRMDAGRFVRPFVFNKGQVKTYGPI